MKRLYRVAVEVTVYVLAKDEVEAAEIGEDGARIELSTGNECPISVNEVRPGDSRANGWTRDSLLYGADRATTLGEALDALEGKR